jgi:PKHD-type hydroxylase
MEQKNLEIDYYKWKHRLSDEECDFLIADCKQEEFSDAIIQSKGGISEHKTRKSNIVWVDSKKLIHRAMTNFMREANQDFFKYNITSSEPIQFSEYKKGDHYISHKDEVWGTKENIRKLTVTILLSDPKSFSGGELQLYNGTNSFFEPLDKRGTIICHNCYDWHNVTPVMDGVRYSLVQWSSGPRFV